MKQRSEHFDPNCAYDDRLLVEPLLEARPVALPPRSVEIPRHHLEHDDVVAAEVPAFGPDTLGGRAREARDPAEAIGEFASHPSIGGAVEAASRIVGERQQNLNEIHAGQD